MFVDFLFTPGKKILVYFLPKKEKLLRAKLLGRYVTIKKVDLFTVVVELNGQEYSLCKVWLQKQSEQETHE